MTRGHSKGIGERDNRGRATRENYTKSICRKMNNQHYKHNRRMRRKKTMRNPNSGNNKIYND